MFVMSSFVKLKITWNGALEKEAFYILSLTQFSKDNKDRIMLWPVLLCENQVNEMNRLQEDFGLLWLQNV